MSAVRIVLCLNQHPTSCNHIESVRLLRSFWNKKIRADLQTQDNQEYEYDGEWGGHGCSCKSRGCHVTRDGGAPFSAHARLFHTFWTRKLVCLADGLLDVHFSRSERGSYPELSIPPIRLLHPALLPVSCRAKWDKSFLSPVVQTRVPPRLSQ